MVLRSARALVAPGIALAVSLAALAPASAGDARSLQEGVFWDPNFDPKITVGAAFGQMDVHGREFVFDGAGNQVSQLNYISHQVGTIGAHLGLQITPWLSAKVEGNVGIDGDSESDDWDWIDPVSFAADDWTHYSYSGDTSIDGMHQVGASARLELFRHPSFAVGVLAGYRWDHFAWSSRGGNYIYSTIEEDGTRTGFRDLIGSSPAGEKGLSYELDYLTPFVGLAANGEFGKFRLDGEYRYSQWGQLDVIDKHYLRSFAARNGMNSVEMHDWRVGASYEIKEGLRLTGDFGQQSFGQVSALQRRYCLNSEGGLTGDDVNCPHFVFKDSKQGADAFVQKYMIGLSYDLN